MFDNGSDLTPLEQNIDKIVAGLTQWASKLKTTGIITPDMVTIEGKDYADALNNMNELFGKNLWSDALPLKPATKEQVEWIMTGTDLTPDTVVVKAVMPRGGIATVQSLAVALAMAGGRPEYLPVVIAVMQALGGTGDNDFGFQGVNTTTCSTVPAIIVNGTISKQIRLGSGYGELGPDPAHPAGVVLGRTIHLIAQDLGGAIPGVGTMAIHGGMRTNYPFFSEDEDGIPQGWTSLAEDRGFTRDQNIVTITPVSSMVNVACKFGDKKTNDMTLMCLSKVIATPNGNAYSSTAAIRKGKNAATGIVILPRGIASTMQKTSGYSKSDIKKFLWDNSKLSWNTVLSCGLMEVPAFAAMKYPAGQDLSYSDQPEQMTVVVAGGDQSGHAYWMQVGHSNHTIVNAEIKLPKNWDDLLKQAVTDLGPLPVVH